MSFGFGFGLPRAPLRGRPLVAAIRALFANGEQGVWFDPSDFSTLFQDAAGTVPVTGVEQPVGLMLDKSRPLGPNLAPSTGSLSGWTLDQTGGSVTAVDGCLFLNTMGTDKVSASFAGLLASARYMFEFEVVSVSGPLYLEYGAGGVAKLLTLGKHRWCVTGRTTFYLRTSSAPSTPGSLLIKDVVVREVPGNHASQPTATSRPVLRQDGNGKYYLYFDGVDDVLVTPTITPGIDKVQVFAGVHRVADTARIICEFSSNFNTNPGSFFLAGGSTPDLLGPAFSSVSRGDVSASALQTGYTAASFAPPVTAVVAALHDIAGDLTSVRGNGVVGANGVANKGAGNFLAYPLYIGRRGGTTLQFNGHIYSMIVRFGSNLPIGTIEQVEAWINGNTEAY